MKKYSLKNIIKLPILKIIIGGLFCILIPVLINKLTDLPNIGKTLAYKLNKIGIRNEQELKKN